MAISVYRWTDGPYVAFTDDRERRYVLERDRAVGLLARMHAHLCDAAPVTRVVVNRRFTRDPLRDLTVVEMYLQDCANLVEIVTVSSPVLLVSPEESWIVLQLGANPAPSARTHLGRGLPSFLKESALAGMTPSEGLLGSSYG